MTPITVTTPVVLFLFKQINTSLCTWYAAISLANTSFLVLLAHKNYQKQFVLSWQGRSIF